MATVQEINAGDLVRVVKGTYKGHVATYMGPAGRVSADVKINGCVKTIRRSSILKIRDANVNNNVDDVRMSRAQYDDIKAQIDTLKAKLDGLAMD